MATVSFIVGCNAVIRVVGAISRGIDSNLFPGKQAASQIVSEVYVVGEGVIGTGGLFDRPHVIGVASDGLGISHVGKGAHDSRAKHFVPEQLANVRNAARPHDQRAIVLVHRGIQVGQDMGVSCTAVVVAWENAMEGHDTIVVCYLDTTKIGRVPSVSGIVARDGNTAIFFG